MTVPNAKKEAASWCLARLSAHQQCTGCTSSQAFRKGTLTQSSTSHLLAPSGGRTGKSTHAPLGQVRRLNIPRFAPVKWWRSSARRTRRCAWNQHARLSRQTLSSAGKSDSVPSSARYVTRRVNGALHCGHQAGSLCMAHDRMHLPAHHAHGTYKRTAERCLGSVACTHPGYCRFACSRAQS